MSKTSLENSLAQSFVFHLWPMGLLLVLLFTACRPQIQATKPASSPSPQTTIATNPVATLSPILNHPYPGTGVVTIINRKEGWIEINHEDIQGLMPAMQMEFWVKNRGLFDHVKVGNRVDFVVVETEKGEYLTEIRKKE
ncbi:MAG TPA: copper-binding protein [Pyrinomonadaceae bacterium]|jgi:Cu/Ag efflux protein CusF|nr:copper-binding protein [Pyrinomonadaceae bacterium]